MKTRLKTPLSARAKPFFTCLEVLDGLLQARKLLLLGGQLAPQLRLLLAQLRVLVLLPLQPEPLAKSS